MLFQRSFLDESLDSSRFFCFNFTLKWCWKCGWVGVDSGDYYCIYDWEFWRSYMLQDDRVMYFSWRRQSLVKLCDNQSFFPRGNINKYRRVKIWLIYRTVQLYQIYIIKNILVYNLRNCPRSNIWSSWKNIFSPKQIYIYLLRFSFLSWIKMTFVNTRVILCKLN